MIDLLLTLKQRKKIARDLNNNIPVRLSKFKVAIIFNGHDLLALVRCNIEYVDTIHFGNCYPKATHKFKLGLGKPIYLNSDDFPAKDKVIVLSGLTFDGEFIQEGFTELIDFTEEDMEYLINYVKLLSLVA